MCPNIVVITLKCASGLVSVFVSHHVHEVWERNAQCSIITFNLPPTSASITLVLRQDEFGKCGISRCSGGTAA
jgi:hypothetical protein